MYSTLKILGLLQEVEINEEVDVIVSEWMGYMLLYEVIGYYHIIVFSCSLCKNVPLGLDLKFKNSNLRAC